MRDAILRRMAQSIADFVEKETFAPYGHTHGYTHGYTHGHTHRSVRLRNQHFVNAGRSARFARSAGPHFENVGFEEFLMSTGAWTAGPRPSDLGR